MTREQKMTQYVLAIAKRADEIGNYDLAIKCRDKKYTHDDKWVINTLRELFPQYSGMISA